MAISLTRMARRRLDKEWEGLEAAWATHFAQSERLQSPGAAADANAGAVTVAQLERVRFANADSSADERRDDDDDGVFGQLQSNFAVATWHVRVRWTCSSANDVHSADGAASLNVVDIAADIEVLFPPSFPSAAPLVRASHAVVPSHSVVPSTVVSNAGRIPLGHGTWDVGGFVLLHDGKHRPGFSWTPISTMVEILADACNVLEKEWLPTELDRLTSCGEQLNSTSCCGYSANELLAGAKRLTLRSEGCTTGQINRALVVPSLAIADRLVGSSVLERLQRGSRVLLPASVLESLTLASGHGSELQFPICFELVVERNGARAFVSPIEFSAPEDMLIIPEWLKHVLSLLVEGTQEAEKIHIRHVTAPNCTKLQFQPHSVDFFTSNRNDRDAVVGLLEAELPHFAILCIGDVIPIMHRGQVHWLNVTAAEPSIPGPVCVISTGATSAVLNVAIDFLPALDDYGQPPLAGSLSQSIDNLEGSLSLPDTIASQHTTGEAEGPNLERCDNCGRLVPLQSVQLHAAMCASRNMRCDKCDAIIDRNAILGHDAAVHALEECPRGCGAKYEKRFSNQHRMQECSHRSAKCQFGCGFTTEERMLAEHEAECGSRTELCDTCNRFVARSEFGEHEQMCLNRDAREIECPLCLFPMAPADLFAHTQASHVGAEAPAEDAILLCPVCDDDVDSVVPSADWIAHLQTHELRAQQRRRFRAQRKPGAGWGKGGT